MTISDHGGWDIALELSPSLATQILKINAPIPQQIIPFATAIASGNATVDLQARDVRFAPGNRITIDFDLGASKCDVTVAPGFPNVPPDLQEVALGGSITVTDLMDVAGLSVSIDTSTDAAAATPEVEVTLDSSVIVASPLITILLGRAYLAGGEAGLAAARQLLLGQLHDLIHTQVIAALTNAPVRQELFAIPARFLPAAAPLSPPATMPPIALQTSSSMLVGVQLGGTAGNLMRITRSSMRKSASGADIDHLVLILSNACLIRDMIRPAVGNLFGLTAAGFLASDPFRWSGSVPLAVSGMTLTITSVAVFIDEMQDIVLLFSFSTSAVSGGVTVSATVSIPITVSFAGGAGSVSAAFMPGRPRVLSSSITIAWWVYLLSAATLGTVGLAALGLANAVGNATISGALETAIAGAITAITMTIPLPAAIPVLTLTEQSLFQADAPLRFVTLPGGISIPALGRDHDLIVGFAA